MHGTLKIICYTYEVLRNITLHYIVQYIGTNNSSIGVYLSIPSRGHALHEYDLGGHKRQLRVHSTTT